MSCRFDDPSSPVQGGLAGAMMRAVRKEQIPQGTVPQLLLSALYKLAYNPNYNLEGEARQYDAFLSKYSIETEHRFEDYFLDVFTGKDFGSGVKLWSDNIGAEVLDNNGRFIDENTRQRVLKSAKSNGFGGPTPV